MGRLIVIVIVLVGIALFINNMKPREGGPAAEEEPKQAESAEQADDSSKEAAPTKEEAETPTSEDTTTEEPIAEEPIAEEPAEEVVNLGEVDLITGISGTGDLSGDEIDKWLDNKQNHAVLKPELPLGLAAGAAMITGIEANPMTRAKIELGRQLYFDKRLSHDETISCATCHDPEAGYAKETQFGEGIGGQKGNRNSPVAYNRILSDAQFWDGRAKTLEEQAVGPIANAIEMGNTHEACVASIKDIDGYVKQFDRIFQDGVTIDNIGKALATFERTLVTGPAPWDYFEQLDRFEKAYADDIEDLDYLKEDDPELYDEYMALKEASEAHPISESAIRGGKLFFSDKSGCTACHLGANFTDEKYHNLGVGMEVDEPDLGRYVVTEVDADRGAFKTPTVRNVSLTAPYMHDGSQKSLLEVVEWYVKGGHPNEHLDKNVKKLDLTDQEKEDLVAFMAEGLLSEFPEVETGRLPK